MLKADLHLHTSYSDDCLMSPEELVARCVETGINCIAVTDHDTLNGALAVQEIAPFPVIIGQEIETRQGEVTGLFLKSPIIPGRDSLETVQSIRSQGGLVSIPHPCDPFRTSVMQRGFLDDIIPYADILEVFNARNTLAASDHRARELAHSFDLLMASVSDAHTCQEVGYSYVEMPKFDGTPQSFREALAQGKLVMQRTTRLIHLKTAYQRVKRRIAEYGKVKERIMSRRAQDR